MGFRVRVEPSGHEFEVESEETVLDAALREGLSLMYSCRNGACGSCKGRLLSGTIDYGRYQAKALSREERANGKALFCQATPLSDLVIEAREVGAAKGITVKILPVRVVRMERLAHDVMGLHLKRPQNEAFRFLAGQYIDVLLKDGRRRSFSLANAPENDALLELHIRRVPGGLFSEHVFAHMQEKALLRIEGPLGTFFVNEESAAPKLFLAGGTGFAPIKGMLEHAFATGMTWPMHLFWGARARRDLYLHDLARGWAERYPHFRYTPVLSQPDPADGWSGATGYVHDALAGEYPDLSGAEVYASGPPAMVMAARSRFASHGLQENSFYFDSFEYAEDGP
ncbi:MAG: CDP-6-deoxy-delta-3,4-glucoseen reductase [Acidiferrobacteraceae bacterium]